MMRLMASVGPLLAPPVVWNARISSDQASMVRAGRVEFADVGVGGVLEEHDQAASGVGEVVGGVDLDEEFAGEPHGGDFAVGITGGESGAEAFPAVPGRWSQVRSRSRRMP